MLALLAVAALQLDNEALLRRWRDQADAQFSNLMQEVREVAAALGIDLQKPRLVSRSQYRSNAASALSDTVEDYYRVNVYIPMLEEVIADLSGRFSPHHRHSFVLTSLLPCNVVQSTWADIQPAISKYGSLLDPSLTVIKAEYTLWQQHWRDDIQSFHSVALPANALDSLNHCHAKSYPNMHLLLKVLATLPVSTATPERVFSKLERTLTALRSTMREDRIEALVLIQAHRDRVISLPVDNV